MIGLGQITEGIVGGDGATAIGRQFGKTGSIIGIQLL